MADIAVGTAVVGIPVSTVRHLIQSMQISQYGAAIMTTAFLYDYLTELNREVEHVWKGKLNLTKLLFLSNRYNTILYYGWNLYVQLVPSPSNKFCQITTSINYFIGLHVMMVGTGVLLLRTWALYDRNRMMLLGFLSVYTIIITALSAFTIKIYLFGDVAYTYRTALSRSIVTMLNTSTNKLVPIEAQSDVEAILTGCYLSGYPEEFFAIFLGGLFCESILFALAMHRLWRLRLSSGLVVMLFRDGLIYYILILAAHLCATLLTLSNGLERALLGSSFYVGVKSIAISHLILRLRGYLITDPELSTPEPTQNEQRTNIRFAPPATSLTTYGDDGAVRSVPVRRELRIDVDGFWVPSSEEYEMTTKRLTKRLSSKHAESDPGSSALATTTVDSSLGSWHMLDTGTADEENGYRGPEYSAHGASKLDR